MYTVIKGFPVKWKLKQQIKEKENELYLPETKDKVINFVFNAHFHFTLIRPLIAAAQPGEATSI